MDFKSATDQLSAAGVPLSALSVRLDVTPHTISRMRRGPGTDPKNRNALRPPRDWQHEVALVALEWAEQREREVVQLRLLAAAVRDGVPGYSYRVENIPPK